MARPPSPLRPIWHHCASCGKWDDGPFAGRLDVPEEEVKAEMEAAGSDTSGTTGPIGYRPARHREGGLAWAGGEVPMLVSHGNCEECAAKNQTELDDFMARRAKLRELLRPVEAPGKPEEGS